VNLVRAFTRCERSAEGTAMQAIAAGLGDADVKAVALYISGMK
jgi:cytochrome c553